MKDPVLALEEIRLRLHKLIGENQALSEKADLLEKRLKTLEVELFEQKNTNKALAEQNKIAKLAVSLGNSTGSEVELKKKLNHYIREIEECIRLVGDSKL